MMYNFSLFVGKLGETALAPQNEPFRTAKGIFFTSKRNPSCSFLI